MSVEEPTVASLLEENARLKKELETRARLSARSLASFQQRALHMEIIRQQNEDLDRLAADLARAKRAEEERSREVMEAARLKSEFLANFSHEIRTPLNGIIGYCDLLSREEGDRLTPHGRRDLSIVKSNAKTLLSLINDILDLSKIEAGRVEVLKESVNLVDLVAECQATVREILKGRDVVLSSRISPEASVVYTDPLKIRQILLNLLSNAAKFTEAGEIAVDASTRGEDLVVVIEDTGMGIPPEQLPLIFEKFRQVDGSATRKVGGTGLGLAIVRELSRVLSGNVTVSSVLGRGSTFTVTLPGAADRREIATTPPPPQVSRATTGGGCVVVIDDDPLIQHLLRGQLEAEGFRVITARDGVEGLRAAREHRPSAILLDLHLPKLDGWAVLTELKSDPALAATPVIIVSVEEQRARGYALGAVDYLVKPVEPERLLSVVQRATRPEAGEVLVVDDDAGTRELVGRQLRRSGFAISEARDGAEALLRIRHSRPSLVILDLVMPNVDGFEVLEKLREGGVDVPVIVLTGKQLSSAEEGRLGERLARVVTKGGQAIDRVVSEARSVIVAQRSANAARMPRVLYVEDAEQNRDIVRRYLQGEFVVLEAEDGEHGVEKAARESPDVILMDLSLPRLDGWEATRRIKGMPALAGIPIIALTAHASREDLDRALAAGCSATLTKPVERDRLLSTIRGHLSARSVNA